MPITQETFESASQVYQETLPKLFELRDQCKELSKLLAKQKKVFKKYMKENSMDELRVGEITFTFESKEKIMCNIDRVEQYFGTDQMAEFKRRNTETKERFMEVCD
ncbi:MAG: hypothetical protein CMD33_01285 [Flavobacteriales bacterium]|nr:hypothetical protein [Flavobacteriales bacterium]